MHVGWGLAEEKFVRSSSGIGKPIRVVPKLAFDPASGEHVAPRSALSAGEAYAQNPPSLPAVLYEAKDVSVRLKLNGVRVKDERDLSASGVPLAVDRARERCGLRNVGVLAAREVLASLLRRKTY